ncbi:OPT family oligopeptide transporter [Bacteroides gallinarum]|uniref:OPT family oligopeptide transporter n=1 Tax=Bacteroides gallinarum TaxID=376806 RepID=UPI000477CA73|nr:oligopeptide transporter, OPT family [Bacteroides gallinarum]
MKQEEEKLTGLPENAFRELKPGEVYNPLMSPDRKYPEVSLWSVLWGIAMAILFSAAAAYLGLKVGQVFEAAIPIAIIAVGVSGAAKRKNALGENVIIQSIGASSGVIVAGAIFTLPALYILQESYPQEITVTFAQVFISSLLGGALGILFLIPFRKYFVSDMHGKYPFPEATATTQVLVSGEKGGSQAKPLLLAGIIGGLYDFIVATFGWWNENFTTRVCGLGEMLAEKAKLVFKVNTGAAVLGLGYIVGLKYASIICAGSLAVWWIIIPGMSLIWGDSVLNQWNPEITATVGAMSPEEIFKYYAKSIGIGGIAMAGIIGIIKSWSIIKSAVGLAAKEMGGKADAEVKRTQRDLSMKIIAIGSIFTLILVALFFYFDVMQGNLLHTVVAILLVAGISFLFTTVAANAIAIVGTNPVSGMTLMTLILASVVMVAVGLKGPGGMVAALVMGGVVCTALSMAGAFITDLKIGYWLGSTPVKQETWKFLGTIVSAATVGGVMIILNKTYGFTSGQLAAPQANAMAAVIEPLMNGVGAPWLLYGIGAVLAIILNACKIPALAFALGMFIPLELNVPLVVGGAINWYVTSRSKDAALNTERGEKGTLLASGFIAGGALMGVVSAAMRFGGVNLVNDAWLNNTWSEVLALGAYAILICYFVKASMKTK